MEDDCTMTIQPVGARLLVKELEAKNQTKSGILLAPKEGKKTQMAEVLAVGVGTEKKPLYAKVGDKIVFNQYVGTEVESDDQKVRLIDADDVLAIVTE